MKLVDLSHEINESISVYPGTPKPKLTNLTSIEKDGFREKLFTMGSHTATHIDAPAHMLKDGASLDELPLSTFYGKATVVDVSDQPERDGFSFNAWNELIQQASIDFVLFHTGWDMKWGTHEYTDYFPFPSISLAEQFVENGLRGIGVDTISVDAIHSVDLPVHHILLPHKVLIIENMTQLKPLIGQIFDLAVFPLKIKKGDGCPVRAVAFTH